MRNKQSGFSIVEGVIAIVVVAVLGLVGWTVYSAHNHPTKKTANATTNTSSTTQPSKENTTAATVTPQSTYLDFKELGVKVTLNSSISDAEYAPFDTPSTDGSKSYGISAQSLVTKETKDYCEAKHGPLGLVIASTTAPANIAGPIAVDNKTVFKYGNTYYMYIPPQNLSCPAGEVTADMVQSKINAFTQAFATLQPDN